MKHYILTILGALFALASMPSSAEARTVVSVTESASSDRHDVRNRYERRDDRRWRRDHRRGSRRVYHSGHWSYRNHHRYWVPGSYVVIRF